MILLYTSVLVVLVAAHFLVKRRAATLERKYAAVLKQAHALLREPLPKEGNSGRTDTYQTAKRTFLLGALAQKKEALEARHAAWASRADRVGRWIKGVRDWRGRKLPYLLGGIDVFSVLCTLEYLGLGDKFSPRHVVQLLTTWLSS